MIRLWVARITDMRDLGCNFFSDGTLMHMQVHKNALVSAGSIKKTIRSPTVTLFPALGKPLV